jgi:hypothetical protein
MKKLLAIGAVALSFAGCGGTHETPRQELEQRQRVHAQEAEASLNQVLCMEEEPGCKQ